MSPHLRSLLFIFEGEELEGLSHLTGPGGQAPVPSTLVYRTPTDISFPVRLHSSVGKLPKAQVSKLQIALSEEEVMWRCWAHRKWELFLTQRMWLKTRSEK